MTTTDKLTAKHTAFTTLVELLNAKGCYYPTLRTESGDNTYKSLEPSEREELGQLADAYDAYQHARGDSRRAHRS